MLKWREDYYVGEGIKDAAKARRRIDAGRVAFGVYLVTLSENPGNLLEFVPSYMLIQKSYYARCPQIVGMAKGKDEAIDLAVDIVKNIYGETGAFTIKRIFLRTGERMLHILWILIKFILIILGILLGLALLAVLLLLFCPVRYRRGL